MMEPALLILYYPMYDVLLNMWRMLALFSLKNYLSVVVKHLRPSCYFWHIEYDGGLPHNLGPRASHPLKRALIGLCLYLLAIKKWFESPIDFHLHESL